MALGWERVEGAGTGARRWDGDRRWRRWPVEWWGGGQRWCGAQAIGGLGFLPVAIEKKMCGLMQILWGQEGLFIPANI